MWTRDHQLPIIVLWDDILKAFFLVYLLSWWFRFASCQQSCLNTVPQPPLTPLLSSALAFLFRPNCNTSCASALCFYLPTLAARVLKTYCSLLTRATAEWVLLCVCVSLKWCLNTWKVERLFNSAGTSQRILGEIAFSLEWACFKINSREMCVLKVNLDSSSVIERSFEKWNLEETVWQNWSNHLINN